MSEEQKVDNHKLAGWKRAILIAVPFVLLGLAVFFMVKGITAWGEDFTRNHGDSYLTLSLICMILLIVGIAMQFVWPKAINKGRRIVVVGLIFNIILAISGVIVVGVGYGVNDSKYNSYSAKYDEMVQEVRKGLDSKKKGETVIPGKTSEQFIKEFNDYLDKFSGKRAIDTKPELVTRPKSYTTEQFYKEYGYNAFAYNEPLSGEGYIRRSSVQAWNVYMGEDAKLEEFAKKYGFLDTKEYFYHNDDKGNPYKLEFAPKWYECVFSEISNRNDESKTIKAHFEYYQTFSISYNYVKYDNGKHHSEEWTDDTGFVLIDLNAKAIRVGSVYFYEQHSWTDKI